MWAEVSVSPWRGFVSPTAPPAPTISSSPGTELCNSPEPSEAPVLPAHHVVTVPCLSCSLDCVSVTIVCLASSIGEGFIQDLLSD